MKPSPCVHQVYFNSAYLNARLSTIELPETCFWLGLTRRGKVFSIADNPEVLEQDWLIAIALDHAMMPELEQCLKQVHAVH